MNKEEFYDELVLNIERIRTEKELTQKEMAKGLDMSLSAYKRFINRENSHFDLYMAFKMYKLCGVMPPEYTPNASDDRYSRIVRKLSNLSENQLIYINAIVEFENQFLINDIDVEDYVTVFIPTGNFEDGMIYDSSNTEKINISKYRHIYGDKIHYGIKVTSNHLHPTYNLGDVLLVSKEPIRDGDTGLFLEKSTSKLYIRKFRQTNPCELIPVNDYGVTKYVNSYDLDDMGKWVKFGKVLCKYR